MKTSTRRGYHFERMTHNTVSRFWSGFALLAVAAIASTPIPAQTLQEYSAEARFQLDLHVPDAALPRSCRRAGSPMSPHRGLPGTPTCE